jgi:hypothetical protein
MFMLQLWALGGKNEKASYTLISLGNRNVLLLTAKNGQLFASAYFTVRMANPTNPCGLRVKFGTLECRFS